MMRVLIILAALFLTAHASTECTDSAPFDCPEGTHCSSWNDGCNDCTCGEGGPDVAMCSLMMCPCLEDNSCVPTCNDNPECVPKEKEEEKAANSIFTCPEGTACMSWNDGCNECFVSSADQTVAGCTEMYCPCYDDNSCVPTCKDNAECVPANANNKLESGSGAADVLKLWLGLFLAVVVGYAQ